jgi:hypothetical protein
MCVFCQIVDAIDKSIRRPDSENNDDDDDFKKAKTSSIDQEQKEQSTNDDVCGCGCCDEVKVKGVDNDFVSNIIQGDLMNWSFDAFEYVQRRDYNNKRKKYPLAHLFIATFDQMRDKGNREDVSEIFTLVNREKLYSFAKNIENGYGSSLSSSRTYLPYHNVAHACEVLHATFAILSDAVAEENMLDPLSIFSLLVAAIAHDVHHPGCDNATWAKERVDIKRRYNGQSLAEMFSCEVALCLLRKSGALDEFTNAQIAFVEDVVAKSILSTDLSNHGKNITSANVCAIIIKCADLTHFARPREIHLKWVSAAMEEQRINTKRNVYDGKIDWKNQVQFAESFVLPTLAILCEKYSIGSTPIYDFAHANIEQSRKLIVQ